VAVSLFCAALVFSLVSITTSFAKDTVVPVPSVTGTIVDRAGEPIEYALVVVTILGSHQKAETTSGDIFKLSVLHDMTDKDGKFTIAADNVNLVDASGKKAFLVGCRVEITQKTYTDLRLDIANPSDSHSGVISIFLNSALQHNGSFFGAISAGFDGIRANAFVPQYVKSLSAEPLIMTSVAEEQENTNLKWDNNSDDDSYSSAVIKELYEANKKNGESDISETAEKINRFNILYKD
jgi:hypothetical protein